MRPTPGETVHFAPDTTMFGGEAYLKAFCFLLILYSKEGEAEGLGHAYRYPIIRTWRNSFPEKENFGPSDVIERFGKILSELTQTFRGKREPGARFPWLANLHESPSTLKNISARLTSILDRISKTWALEGAKTIQNGEIRLRRLNKEVTDKITQLISNNSKYGDHVRLCLNRTVFETELETIIDDTTKCYSRSLLSVEEELKKIEDEESAQVKRMEEYGDKMFRMLSNCFLKETTSDVIECLQSVDGTNMGREIHPKASTDLIVEVAGTISDIPRTFSDCTSRGLVETEALIRKGYSQSLACLKEQVM